MEIILKEDVSSLGKAGDVVKVKKGYARNFLLPQGKAIVADPNNVKSLEHHRRVVAGKQAKLKKESESLATKMESLSITIAKDVGEQDKLFGSVTAKDIAEALRKENLVIDRKQIHLEAPIKQIGVSEVKVRLHPEVVATLKVWVVKND